MTHQMTDVKLVYDGGSVGILIPKSDAAQEWFNDNVSTEDAVRFGDGIAVEMRYVNNILNALSHDGFIVEFA